MDSPGFRYLEHTADLRFESYGETLDECFVNAAKAFFSAMIDLGSVKAVSDTSMDISAESLEMLMHDWLTEALFLFETESMVFSAYSASIKKEKNAYRLRGKLSGEKFDSARHRIQVAVKAVTYHGLSVKQKEGGWVAEVLCDV